MALADLQADILSNRAEAQRLLDGDPENPLLRHLVHTLWPFQEALLEEMEEQAEALDDIQDQSDDILHAETAGVFAAVIIANGRLADELERKLGPSEIELRGVISTARKAAAEATQLLADITLPDTEDDGDEDEEEDDDDDDAQPKQ